MDSHSKIYSTALPNGFHRPLFQIMEQCRTRIFPPNTQFGSSSLVPTCGCDNCRQFLPSLIREQSVGLTLFSLPRIPLHEITPPFNPFLKYACWTSDQKDPRFKDNVLKTFQENSRLFPRYRLNNQNQLLPTTWSDPQNFYIPSHIFESILFTTVDLNLNFIAPIPPNKDLSDAISYVLSRGWLSPHTSKELNLDSNLISKVEVDDGRQEARIINISVCHFYDSLFSKVQRLL